MEGRPWKKGIFSSSNLYVHFKTVFATQAWGVIQHMVIHIKPNCCYLPSLETGQGTSGLESPLWIFGAPTKSYLAQEETRCLGEGAKPSVCTSLEAQTLLPSEVHPPSPLPHLGGRSWENTGIPAGHGDRELCLSWCGSSATPHWPSMNKREK